MVCSVAFNEAMEALATALAETDETLLTELTDATEMLETALRIELRADPTLFTGDWY